MSVKLSRLVLYLSPVLLGATCIPSDNSIRSDYGRAKTGRVVLIGYLRSTTELTLYAHANDAQARRYKNCINGTVENMDPASTILYDNKFVEIEGYLSEYYVGDDDLSAMLASVKNNCNSPKVFVARQIRMRQEKPGQ